MKATPKITKSILKNLYHPSPFSHKGDNGRLLIIGGSKKYHGAPILAARVASKIVDLVYFFSTPPNNKLIQKMKGELAEFITLRKKEINKYLSQVDSVLVGPGLGVSQETKKLVNNLLKKFPAQKFVLDADALKVIDPELLNKNHIVTPHKKEFETLFKIKATRANVRKMAKKYRAIIVLKGREDLVCDLNRCFLNTTGNQGMTKGGTGDVLAGLIAALVCKNDLFLAARAGVFTNGVAGDKLKEQVSYYYNASDLIQEIPKIFRTFAFESKY